MSWILGALYAPPRDGAQATLAACAAMMGSNPLPTKGLGKKKSVAAQHASQFRVCGEGGVGRGVWGRVSGVWEGCGA